MKNLKKIIASLGIALGLIAATAIDANAGETAPRGGDIDNIAGYTLTYKCQALHTISQGHASNCAVVSFHVNRDRRFIIDHNPRGHSRSGWVPAGKSFPVYKGVLVNVYACKNGICANNAKQYNPYPH